jgi:hypothetical protein
MRRGGRITARSLCGGALLVGHVEQAFNVKVCEPACA